MLCHASYPLYLSYCLRACHFVYSLSLKTCRLETGSPAISVRWRVCFLDGIVDFKEICSHYIFEVYFAADGKHLLCQGSFLLSCTCSFVMKANSALLLEGSCAIKPVGWTHFFLFIEP